VKLNKGQGYKVFSICLHIEKNIVDEDIFRGGERTFKLKNKFLEHQFKSILLLLLKKQLC